MRKSATPSAIAQGDTRLFKNLQRAVNALGSLQVLDAAYQDVSGRINEEPNGFMRPSTRMGIVRTLDHYLSAEVHSATPNWRRLRALHRAWQAAVAFDEAGSRK